MDVVEIGIVQVAAVMTDHTFRQTAHSGFLSFFDDDAERLKFDEAVAQVDNGLVVYFIWMPKKGRKPRMNPPGNRWFVSLLRRRSKPCPGDGTKR
ncbi:MAG TPA: hypothetical protein VH643_11305 [Gemmataceae bacterium]